MVGICWQQHGGSGLLITWSEALELEVIERDALLELINERRNEEAKAIEKAQRKRK